MSSESRRFAEVTGICLYCRLHWKYVRPCSQDEQINDNLLPSLPSSTISTLSPVSGLMNEQKVALDDDKQSDEHKQIEDERYDYLPQDYALTERDLCAHVIIETSLKNDLLVKIDDISVKQHQMVCLLDDSKWLNDDVISAYICCIKDQVHVQNKNDGKVYFENPFISRLLKRDGGIGIHGDGTFMTDIVRNYLKYDMIELPINIDNKHWYLAIVNAKKSEIQVFDSLCWEFNRNDLTTMLCISLPITILQLQGLQYHLDILRRQQDSISHKWTDLDVTKWMITEQLREPIQEDSSSCGLFMLKFMEYSTEDTLCHPITQEIITPFRYKLASILLCWKTNTAAMTTMLEQSDIEEDPNDVVMLESPEDQNKAKSLNSLSFKNKYQSLISVISNMSLHALVGRLCSYIKSIKCMETLEELSGYLVTHFMPTWEDENLHLPVLKDGYELRKQISGQLLTFKENECENNMPAGILEFISCIREIQNKAEVVTILTEDNMAQKYTGYISKCPLLSYEDEQPLRKDTCMHAEPLQAMCIWKDEKHVQVEMIISCALDVHALEGKQEKEYSNYFGEPRLQGGIKEFTMDLLCLLAKIGSYKRFPQTERFQQTETLGRWMGPGVNSLL
uniref:Ubiquitin-like protease family profile domain-containing protein n=1 Tax=Aegilops tauschii TaxID=37682 RepID=N1QW98_AEGTA